MITAETLEEWRDDVEQGCGHGLAGQNRRILALLDEVERLTEALSASEQERDDLDTAVGTLLGENVELEAEVERLRGVLRQLEGAAWMRGLYVGPTEGDYE